VVANRDNYNTVDMVIQVSDAYDVQLWSLVLGASEEDVLAATDRVGTDAKAVQLELERLRQSKVR
jgi:hypothetical protein